MNRKKKKAPTSVVRTVVEKLREDALESEDGDLIGSEDDLISRYGVSRPTLRQAAALIAQEQLLQVRRGVGGGYIARRPSSQATAHMATIYLQSRGSRADELIRSLQPIRVALAYEAARNSTPELRQQMEAFLKDQVPKEHEEFDYNSFVTSEQHFGQLMGEMSQNKVLSLFLNILYELSGSLKYFESLAAWRPERLSEYLACRNCLAQALIDGDAEQAVLFERRCSRMAAAWMTEDNPGEGRGADAEYDILENTLTDAELLSEK